MIKAFREFLYRELSNGLPVELGVTAVGYPARDTQAPFAAIQTIAASRGEAIGSDREEWNLEVTFLIVDLQPNWQKVNSVADAIIKIFAIDGRDGFCSDGVRAVFFVAYQELSPGGETLEDSAQATLTLRFQYFKEMK